MRTAIALAALISLLPAGGAGAAPEIRIALRDGLSTDRLYYTLGEIATVTCADTELRSRLRALRIGLSPRIGQASGLPRAAIAARVERAFPGLHRWTTWEGPPRTVVRAVGSEVPLDAYSGIAQSHLAEWLGARADSFEIRRIETEAAVTLPRGAVSVTPRIGSGTTLRKRMRVWLDFRVEDRPYAAVPVWFEVSAWRGALVAARPLPAGTPLSSSDVIERVVDIADAPGTPVEDLAALEGQRLRHAVAAGVPLSAESLEPLPEVARGEELVVTARAGRVVVEALAVSLEDGREGETIRVVRPGSDVRYDVRVVGRQRATVGRTGR